MDNFIKKLKVENLDFLDIGCSGDLSAKWDSIIPYFNYIGFDPNKDECERLSSVPNKFKSAKYLPYAVAGQEGAHKMYQTKSIYCYSLLKPNNDWLNRFSYYDLFTVKGTEDVSCVTLDALSSSQKIKGDIIKLDTQGLELPILKSSQNVLEGAICVETETGFLDNYIGETTYSEVDEYMRSKGYLMMDMVIRKVGRNNDLGKYGKHQPMWCEAVWMYDFVGNKKKCSEKTAIKALVICKALKLYDYGLELSLYFYEIGLINKEVFKFLSDDKNWEESFLVRIISIYTPKKIKIKIRKFLIKIIDVIS